MAAVWLSASLLIFPEMERMNQRFYSLDVFRGATVAFMILVNNPGSWEHIYPPLEHASWHGVTPTDLVFPFFLFAVGNALAFVLPKLEAAGEAVFWKKIITRSLLIFGIGLLLSWFPFVQWQNDQLGFRPWNYINADGNPAGVRIAGVLQRIALCYFFACGMAHYLKPRGAFVASAFLLLAYWFCCIAANPADPFSLQGWFGTKVDLDVLGAAHMYKGEGVAFDPEGLMSTPAAIVEVVFGWLAGTYIIQKGKSHEMVNGLFVAAAVLIFTGYCWGMVFPMNKKIWTSSFTVYTSGLGLLVLAVMVHLVEFRRQTGAWTRFFEVFGKNALFIFVMSGVIPRLSSLLRIPAGTAPVGKPAYLTPLSWFYENACKPILAREPNLGSLIYALCFLTVMWLLAWLLDRKKIYIRV
jgi:predicted acyltransferase